MPNLHLVTPRDGDAIRPAVRADLPALRQVIKSTNLFPDPLLEGMMDGYLTGVSPPVIWLTYADPVPSAVAYAAPEVMGEGTWNLFLLAVHADRHSQGIGRSLVGYLEELLAVEGVRLLLVETSATRPFARTRDFYQQLGYQEEARIRDFYSDGDDKIVFRKTL